MSICNVKTLNIQVNFNCNLSCDGCNSNSPYFSKPNIYEIDKFENDIKYLSKYLYSNVVYILGGEPLYLQNLEQYIDILKYYNITNSVELLTNGLLLESYKNTNIFNKLTSVRISYYPEIKTHEKIDNWLLNNQHFTCKFDKFYRNKFNMFLTKDKIPNDNILKIYKRQSCKRCYFLYNGRFYGCASSISNPLILKNIYNINEDLDDSVLITDFLSGDDIKKHLILHETLPYKNCSYCYGSHGKVSPHKQIKVRKID